MIRDLVLPLAIAATLYIARSLRRQGNLDLSERWLRRAIRQKSKMTPAVVKELEEELG